MKMARTMTKEMIPVWTDRPSQAILLAIATVIFFALADFDVPGLQWVTVSIMGFVVLAASLGNGPEGFVIGLIGAAVFIGVHTAAGEWTGQEVLAPLVTVFAFIAYGGLCGLVAGHLRRRHALLRREPAAGGAGGSLGLLTAAQGRAALYTELDRSQFSGEPLSLVTVHARVQDGVAPQAAKHALRAVARAVETSAGPGMLPVFLNRDRFGVILPDHDAAQAASVRDRLLGAIERATFADRSRGGSRRGANEAVQVDAAYLIVNGQYADTEIFREFSSPGGVEASGTTQVAA